MPFSWKLIQVEGLISHILNKNDEISIDFMYIEKKPPWWQHSSLNQRDIWTFVLSGTSSAHSTPEFQHSWKSTWIAINFSGIRTSEEWLKPTSGVQQCFSTEVPITSAQDSWELFKACFIRRQTCKIDNLTSDNDWNETYLFEGEKSSESTNWLEVDGGKSFRFIVSKTHVSASLK